MSDDIEELEASPEYTPEDLKRLGEKWLERIRAAEKREDKWIKNAEKAEKAYLCDDETPSDVPEFNILHSNVETIVPSIYNSTPVPDIRPRHNKKDPVAKIVSDVIERTIAAQIDDGRLDSEIEKAAQDAFMAGRGVLRVKFDADVEDGNVSGEQLIFEVVSWGDYREGPAKRWSEVPWVAFQHCISEEELERLSDDELRELQMSPEASLAADDDADVKIWEIWCKKTGRVYFIVQDTGFVIDIQEDPLGLSGFFPMPEPVQPITGTGSRKPVCPYTVYKTLAEELDRQTRRINAIVSGLKVRGAIAADADAISALAQADDNELVSIGNMEGLIAAGGLDKAVMWWPIETAIAVLRELYVQREQTKQSIYEITGISDIIRGQGNASETATAQQIKTEWGSLRIKKMQRLIERQVRDIFVIAAEIISSKFSRQTLQMASGIEIPDEAAQFFERPLDNYRIDVESDSTVRADSSRNRKEMSEFLQGTAQFFNTMAPVVAQAPQAAGPVVEMYSSFARQFNLGKQAEDALEQFAEMAKQVGEQPQKPDPAAEAEKAKMAMEAEAKKAEMQLKAQGQQAEMQLKAQGQQADLQFKAAQLEMDKQRFALEQAKFGAEMKFKEQEAMTRQNEAAGKLAEGGEIVSGMVGEAMEATKGDIQAGFEGLAQMIAQLAQAMQAGDQQIIDAMMAPKEIIKDENGRPVGVRPMQRMN